MKGPPITQHLTALPPSEESTGLKTVLMAYPLWRGRKKLSVGILTGREKAIRARRMGYGLTEADPAVIGSEANNYA